MKKNSTIVMSSVKEELYQRKGLCPELGYFMKGA